MLFTTVTTLTLLTSVLAATAKKQSRTFAVLHFHGDGPLTQGRADPIINPGTQSSHVHAIQGGSNFALTMSDTTLLQSSCTSANVKNDHSNYWTPSLYFQHANGSFESVPMFYMNVYYFFEPTNDNITAFPPGLRMVVGDPTARTPPYTPTNVLDLNQGNGTPQPVQWTCPRTSYNVPSYPANSDGLSGVGIQDPNNLGAGVGFPDQNCDGFASPLRADIHFPSCYNPAVGLQNYKENTKFPSSKGTAGSVADCPAGWIHLPHIFYEVYWNTPLFKDLWTPGQGKQPFILANGDRTGYSLHADFLSGWDTATLQSVIDTCNTGDSGMDLCPNLIGGANKVNCNIPIPTPAGAAPEQISGVMDKLPGNNPPSGWGAAAAASGMSSAPSAATAKSTSASAATKSASVSSKAATQAGSTSLAGNVLQASAGVFVASSVTSALGAATGAPKAGSDTTTYTTFQSSIVVKLTQTVTRAPSSATGAATSSTGTASVQTISGFNSIGCYSDANTRALTGVVFAPLGNNQVTMTKCINYCAAQGFTVAGTEYGGQCFCDNAISSAVLDSSKCSMPCQGNANEICGGSWALSVWQKGNAAAAASKREEASSDRKARHVHRHADFHAAHRQT